MATRLPYLACPGDVGVEVEDVAGIVGRLDLGQALILPWPVRRADTVLLVFGHEVHVTADAAGVRHQVGPEGPHPSPFGLKQLRGGADGLDADHIPGVPAAAEGGGVLAGADYGVGLDYSISPRQPARVYIVAG